jgi:4-nitrophenyl phosphatase/NagD protein
MCATVNYSELANIQCFIFDMDGTIYLGDQLLPGAKALIKYLHERGIPHFFLTNNSSRSSSDYMEKLTGFGLATTKEAILTSGEATVIYVRKHKPGARIYLVGTPSLESEFQQAGFDLVEDNPDYAVLGFDTTLTYSKIWRLCDFVREGVPYIATHPDINCPTENGFMPDIGSMIAFVAASTGQQPDVIVGKPHPPMVEAVLEKTGFRTDQLAMVGDRLYTDIAMGKTGITTVLVLSGETKKCDLAIAEYKPDYVIEDVGELLATLRSSN